MGTFFAVAGEAGRPRQRVWLSEWVVTRASVYNCATCGVAK